MTLTVKKFPPKVKARALVEAFLGIGCFDFHPLTKKSKNSIPLRKKRPFKNIIKMVEIPHRGVWSSFWVWFSGRLLGRLHFAGTQNAPSVNNIVNQTFPFFKNS